MNDKLNRCPFCAAPGYWDSIEDKSLWWCGCRECDVATQPFDTLAEAVAAWNRRATPTPPVEPVKEADVSDADTLKALRCAAVALAHAANRSPNNSAYDKAYEEVDAAIRALRGRTA